MLVTLVFLPVFFVFGIVFGFISWLMAAWVSCGSDWTKKWQTFALRSFRMSRDHNVLLFHGADFVLAFECVKPIRNWSKNILIGYYKVGHSISIFFVLTILSFVKALLLVPIWQACCCGDAQTERVKQILEKHQNQNPSASTKLKVAGNELTQVLSTNDDNASAKKASATSGAYDSNWMDDADPELKNANKIHNVYANDDQHVEQDDDDDNTSSNAYGNSAYD